MRTTNLENGSVYHIYNRGVEKRNIFLDNSYYHKFLNNLWDLNDNHPTPDNRIHRDRDSVKREKLVEIYAYVLMPNHYHLVIRQLVDGGIEKFMRKLGVSYSMYFNIREKRVGPLFQGRFKAKLVEDDVQLLQLIKYIHLNPLKIYKPNYLEHGTVDKKEAFDYVEKYPWSSYGHYAKEKKSDLIDDFTEVVTLDEDKFTELIRSDVFK